MIRSCRRKATASSWIGISDFQNFLQNLSSQSAESRKGGSRWAVAFVAVVALLVFGGICLLNLWKSTVKDTGEIVGKVMQSFNQKTVREEFISYGTQAHGVSRYQFASLKEMGVCQRRDEAKTGWGLIPLPSVVVEARVPVEYTYYLDFAGAWEFEQRGAELIVYAPPILTNSPAPDISQLKFYTLEGSIWRSEKAVEENLLQAMTAHFKEQSLKNIPTIQEIGRKQLVEFTETWLSSQFADGKSLRVKVIFPNERVVLSKPDHLP